MGYQQFAHVTENFLQSGENIISFLVAQRAEMYKQNQPNNRKYYLICHHIQQKITKSKNIFWVYKYKYIYIAAMECNSHINRMLRQTRNLPIRHSCSFSGS